MNKYDSLYNYIKDQYPGMDVFINDERFVIEKNKKEILTYQPGGVIFANLNQIPNALEVINDYNLLISHGN